MGINRLSTQLLIDSYEQAKQLNLETDFISLLGNELHKRKLEIIDSSFEEKNVYLIYYICSNIYQKTIYSKTD